MCHLSPGCAIDNTYHLSSIIKEPHPDFVFQAQLYSVGNARALVSLGLPRSPLVVHGSCLGVRAFTVALECVVVERKKLSFMSISLTDLLRIERGEHPLALYSYLYEFFC